MRFFCVILLQITEVYVLHYYKCYKKGVSSRCTAIIRLHNYSKYQESETYIYLFLYFSFFTAFMHGTER